MTDHSHHHGHKSHNHEGATDDKVFTEVNRQHWNKYASSYSVEEWQKDLLNKTTAFILSNIDWIGVDFVDPASTFESNPDKRQVRVLDYACGPGTITHALGSHATEYVGIDVSENMVKAYNLRFNPDPVAAPSATDADEDEEVINAHAIVGNLIAPESPPESLSGAGFHDFDLVAVGYGYHHFSNLPFATKRLVERLRPGGIFLIVDFVTHAMELAPAGNPAVHTVAHNGFSEAALKDIFEGAGLEDFKLKRMGEEVVLGREDRKREPFIAVGRKA